MEEYKFVEQMFIFISLLIIYYDSIYRFDFRIIKYIHYRF